MTADCRRRLRDLGYGALLDEFNLATHGIVTLFVPDHLLLGQVLSPESRDPKPPSVPCYRLTRQQHDEIVCVMFSGAP